MSVDLGDFDGDDDTLTLQVFNAANVTLGLTTLFIPSSFTGMMTLSLSAPNIAYAVFGSTAPSLNGSSVFADNFTYAAAVPEPSSLLLLGMGLIGGARMWRRRQTAA